MGFFDNLSKIANTIDKVTNTSSKIMDNINTIANSENYSNSNQQTNTTINHESCYVSNSTNNKTPINVIESVNTPIGSYNTAEGSFFSGDNEYNVTYEIPDIFGEFNSYAEPDMCYLYMFDDNDKEDINLNKPYICITPELYNYIEEYKNTGTISNSLSCETVSYTDMIFKAKINYLDKICYFYAISMGEDTYALSLNYGTDVENTDLEIKLMNILDHCAETYKQELV